MNATVSTHTNHIGPVNTYLEVPLGRIRESRTNPRHQFDETALAELADNIGLHGVLQPVLVRPIPDELGLGSVILVL